MANSFREQVFSFLLMIWMNRKNMKLVGPIFTILLAVSYQIGLLQTIISWILLSLIIIFSILSGLALVLCRGEHREPPAPRPTREQQNVTRVLEKLTKKYSKHYYKSRLVISKDLDKAIQEVIDFTVRDFCLSWFSDIGKDETAFVEIVNKELWTVIENLLQRLYNIDKLNLLCSELVFLLDNHFHDLRLSDARKFPGQTSPFLLHPCLKDKSSEMKYVRTCSEALLYTLLPESDSNCSAMRYVLREIIAGSIILATAESVCDPDYINQTLVIYLEEQTKITETRKQKYAYAETYEDFIKMINTSTDIENLKQIRYHTIAEIMQATVIHNSSGDVQEGVTKTKKQSKKDALRDRDLKRYINQCRVAKSQCEKRIRGLGGPDYRVYGLGHGQPLEEADKKKLNKKAQKKNAKILAFGDILENSLARSFFMMFLQRHGCSNFLRFWIETEKLRLLKGADLTLSATQIFQEYVTPSAINVIKLNSTLVRGMEEYVYGTGGPEFFYEAQKLVYDIMESKYYPEFVLSHDYTEFVCQSESAMDELRAHLDKDEMPNLDNIDWSDGFGFKERRNAEALKAAMPGNIEERNDFAVRKLQALDQNINAKTQALELVKRAHPVDQEEKSVLEREIDQLNTERRHLEFHIERTDLWCEMLGHWKALISNVQLHPDNEEPLFVICVSCDETVDTTRDSPVTAATGWVVCRQLHDFKQLHDNLRECCSWMSKELPVSSKRWYKKNASENLESIKASLQEYINIILNDNVLSQSDEVYAFLIPSPEYLRGQASKSAARGEGEKKTQSFFNNIKGKKKLHKMLASEIRSLQNLTFPDILVNAEDAEEVDAGIEERKKVLHKTLTSNISVQDRKDSIAEPMYKLISEVFELKGVFKMLRKTLISFVRITFGGTINRHLHEFVNWLVSEPMLVYYIDNFKQSMWPKGKLAPYPPERTNLEKLRTREQAKERMMKSIPDVLSNLVGKRNSKLGFMKVRLEKEYMTFYRKKLFEALQDIKTNKHLFYMMLELLIIKICPEVKSEKVLTQLQKNAVNVKEHEKIYSPTIEANDLFGDDEAAEEV